MHRPLRFERLPVDGKSASHDAPGYHTKGSVRDDHHCDDTLGRSAPHNGNIFPKLPFRPAYQLRLAIEFDYVITVH